MKITVKATRVNKGLTQEEVGKARCNTPYHLVLAYIKRSHKPVACGIFCYADFLL